MGGTQLKATIKFTILFLILIPINLFLAIWAIAIHKISGNDICTAASLAGQPGGLNYLIERE